MKIIIECQEGIDTEDALIKVLDVIRMGRTSKAGDIAHYCFHSCYFEADMEIIVRKKKSKTAADSFIVRKMEVRG